MNGSGWIEVICGFMFSNKTEELIRRVRREKIAKFCIIIFKPIIDKRYSKKHIVSHNNHKLRSQEIKDPEDIIPYSKDYNVIGIDEAKYRKCYK